MTVVDDPWVDIEPQRVIPRDLAQLLIKDKNLDFGFPTRKGLLPSAADKQALSQREVAVIDYSQQLFVGHRTRIVSAITKKLSELALRQKQPSYGEDSYLVFEKHLGTPRNKQAAPPRRRHQESSTDEKTLRETSEAAIHNMQKTTEECLRKVQQAATPAPPTSSTTPETKHLLSNIGHELELLNQKAAAAATRTEAIETTAAERHQDITSGIRDFHSTYKDTGREMVDTLVGLTNRLTKTPEEDRQEASSEGGLRRGKAQRQGTGGYEDNVS
ncbi:hypothetical protein CYMTET_10456 [Cymbomonas tetramitiformis]|uniref:Uncharacterized protein n=1 Tax=Cymbomonas tetramitiformis TaxID=36881 RepID=A0AAE0LDU5_9CHLO|nr:hypothetical protein CYMTET_10456 [Cymbomonas tetramitiformis]